MTTATAQAAPNLTGQALQDAFVQDELTTQSLAAIPGNQYTNVGRLDSLGILSGKALRSSSIEGSVYGALYLHLSRLIGLREVMNLVFRSQATTFSDLTKYVASLNSSSFQNNRKKSAMRTVVRTWFH